MVAFFLGIILGSLGGFLLLALLSEVVKLYLAQKGGRDKVRPESLMLAAADSYQGSPPLPEKSPSP